MDHFNDTTTFTPLHLTQLVAVAKNADVFAQKNFDCHVHHEVVRFAPGLMGLQLRLEDEEGVVSEKTMNMFLGGFWKKYDRDGSLIETVSMLKLSIFQTFIPFGSKENRIDFHVQNDPQLVVGVLMSIPED